MEEAALKQSEKAVQKVQRALADLGSATDLVSAQDAWEDCLGAVHRVYEKLKAGARGNSKSWAWFGKMQDERRDDELLCYVHHARNSDHHRFDEVAKQVPGGISIGARGAVHLRQLIVHGDGRIDADWSPASPGSQLIVEHLADRLHVVPVIDSGIEYPVPTKHRGDAVRDHDELTIARAVSVYVEWMVSEARSLRR